MIVFLVNVNYSLSYYMDDGVENYESWHLVYANDIESATLKVEGYYNGLTNEYDVYYSVNSIKFSETIL